MSDLTKPIISIKELVPLCRGCPSDWETTDHLDRYIYIRFRWGRLTVSVGETETTTERIYSEQVSDHYDGFMEAAQMIEHTKGVIEWIEHRLHFKAKS